MSLLRVENLSRDYQGQAVLRGVSFALEPGEHLGVLGPSGSGKSTLLRLITGLETPDGGRIEWKGQDIAGTTGRFGFMNQRDLLLPWKPLWENAGLPLLLAGQPRARVRQVVENHLEALGLAGAADRYPHQLSGGMRQRAAFLRTFLANSELLLLDEPFAALDVLLRAQLQDWLARQLERLGSTLILVTHSVDEALLLCHRVLVLSPAPGTVLRVEACAAAALPYAERAYSPAFLNQRKRLLDTLLDPTHAQTGGPDGKHLD